MKRILLAEDNELQSRVLWELLHEEGLDINIAEDGIMALKMLKENEPYDLIVSDCNMPKMDGFVLAHKVKEDPKLKNIPFIMYSSRPTVEGMKLAYEYKVDKYVQQAGIRGVREVVLDLLKQDSDETER